MMKANFFFVSLHGLFWLSSEMKQRILFVCLGNICRSPAAEAVMQQLIDRNGVGDRVAVDSAGTYGGHAGDRARL